MSTSMRRVFISTIFLIVAGSVFATSVTPINWLLEKEDLASNGVSIHVYEGKQCANANDVYIAFQNTFHEANFSSASIEFSNKDGIAFYASLPLLEVDDNVYTEKPFYGVTFCMVPNLMGSTTIKINYNQGQLTTNVIVLNNLESLTQ